MGNDSITVMPSNVEESEEEGVRCSNSGNDGWRRTLAKCMYTYQFEQIIKIRDRTQLHKRLNESFLTKSVAP